jgi:CubicO group peptidase (beta-lactamase class C family)
MNPASTLCRAAVVLGMGLALEATAAPRSADDTTAALVEEAMSDAGVVGLAVVRLHDGQVVDVRGFGQATVGGGDIDPDNVFQAASLGKVATAYAALILIEQGKLRLDQRLTDPRIDVPEGCAVPTVRAVLTHASGMSNDLTASRFRTSCSAGDAFRYSGQGFLALATEIEREGDRPATELIATLVFEPLGVRGQAQTEREMPADLMPASLSTTARDMGRLAAELLSPRLLSGTKAQHLLEPVSMVSDCIGWSLVMGTDRCGGQFTAWQWGTNLGFQGLLVLAPASGDGVVILTNTGGGIDAVLPGRGGYPAAKRIAAGLLGIEGRWDPRD